MEEMDIQEYTPPGPVAAAFLNDPSFGRFIMGPQGSGKTGACCFDLLVNAAKMPICSDGYRRMRVVAVRNTYGDLSKTIESWLDWVPKERGSFKGGDNRPAQHHLFYEMDDCLGLKFELRFLAVEQARLENVFRGNEFTAGWLNEADLLAPDVVSFMSGRVGRYPPQRRFAENTAFRKYIIGDFNAPDIDNYLYKELVESRPENFAFFHQPSGLSPDAENVKNLISGYYEEQAAANVNKPWWVDRMILSKWGYSRDGEPVYPEYQDQFHCTADSTSVRQIPVNPDLPLLIGLDAGMHPAAVIGQSHPNGQLVIVEEIVPGRQGPKAFGRALLDWLNLNITRPGIAGIWADPSAFYGGDRQGGDYSWVETVEEILQTPILAAPSNELHVRLESVRDYLTLLIDGREPGLKLSPHCRILRKGFAANYRYRRVRVGTAEQFADKPDKNDYSHPHDALQYLASGHRGRYGVIAQTRAGSLRHMENEPDSFVARTDFDIFGI